MSRPMGMVRRMAGRGVQIAPSILSADMARLGDQVREAEAAGADAIHIDVMDGVFVPRITFGPIVVEAVRSVTSLPLDVHLMINAPERQIEHFIAAGASTVIVHVESTRQLGDVVRQIREGGARVAVTLKPETELGELDAVLAEVDQVQVMSVNPGWSGQPFIPESLARLQAVRRSLERLGIDAVLEVDGGVNEQTAASVVAAGANLVVAGSAVFNERESVAVSMRRLRSAIAAG